MLNTDKSTRELLEAVVHDCAVQHVGETTCPECGEHHKQIESLPDRPLHSFDMESASTGGLQIRPAFRLHLDGPDLPAGYLKFAPSILLAHSRTFRLVEFSVEAGWVVVEKHNVDNDLNAETEAVRQRVIKRLSDEVDLPMIDNDPRP